MQAAPVPVQPAQPVPPSDPAAALREEIGALARLIREDREAVQEKDRKQKEKEKSESWVKYVSLTIVSLAVCAAIGTLRAGRWSNRTLLRQNQASDQWAYYQSKGTKMSVAEIGILLVPPDKAAPLKSEISKFEKQKEQIKAKAEKLEQERDEAKKHGGPLATAVAFLQIAIAVSSVSLLTKRKALWFTGGGLGLIGIGWLIHGLFI
jgi:hypothetical protein